MKKLEIEKIISGGQTGADQAALDFAIERKIPHGGWIPKGRLTERGHLSQKYQLKETNSSSYEERTKRNVLEADATVIFCYDQLFGGSLLTLLIAQNRQRIVKVIEIRSKEPPASEVRRWLIENQVRVLNVAGPRASMTPQIYDAVIGYLNELFG